MIGIAAPPSGFHMSLPVYSYSINTGTVTRPLENLGDPKQETNIEIMGDNARPVKIQATYWIGTAEKESSSSDGPSNETPPTRTQSFGPSSPITDTHTMINTPLRAGLPEGAKPDKNSDGYSGLHDQGPLPPLKEGGPMAVLMSCVQEAKNFNDQYLTEVISAQRKTETKAEHNITADAVEESTNPLKRTKVSNSGEL